MHSMPGLVLWGMHFLTVNVHQMSKGISAVLQQFMQKVWVFEGNGSEKLRRMPVFVWASGRHHWGMFTLLEKWILSLQWKMHLWLFNDVLIFTFPQVYFLCWITNHDGSQFRKVPDLQQIISPFLSNSWIWWVFRIFSNLLPPIKDKQIIGDFNRL